MPTPDERARLLEVLRKILQSIAVVRDEWEIFETAVRESVRQLGYEWVSIVLQDLDERSARVFLSVPSGPGALRVGEVVDQASGFWEAMRSGSAFVRESLGAQGPLWEDSALAEAGVTSYAAIPLRVRGKTIGTYNVGSRDPARIVNNVSLMTQLAEFLANAVVAARLIGEVQQGLIRLHDKVTAAPLPLPLL